MFVCVIFLALSDNRDQTCRLGRSRWREPAGAHRETDLWRGRQVLVDRCHHGVGVPAPVTATLKKTIVDRRRRFLPSNIDWTMTSPACSREYRPPPPVAVQRIVFRLGTSDFDPNSAFRPFEAER